MSLTPTFHKLRIADRRQETTDCVSLAFTVPEALRDAYRFAPGQYLTLRDAAGMRRSYSICTAPRDNELRIAIKRVPGGRFSAWACAALHTGDSIDVMPPQGRFGAGILGDGQTYAAFAAGSGITPVMSILRTVLAQEANSRFHLFYASRSRTEIIFRDAIEDLKDRHLARLSVFHVLSREQQDLPVLGGHLDAAFIRAVLPTMLPPARIDHALLCGPAGMLDALPPALAALGIAPGRIHAERFTPAPGAPFPAPPPPAPDAPARAMATAILGGASLQFPVRGEDTLIEAAERAGIELPWSCKGGMCCTCRARLLQGSVEMATNYSLENWEQQAGFVLTCQSRPTSARVVVDYDQV